MKLKPMSQERFEVYFERLIAEFAEDRVRSGNWPPDTALERSRDQVAKLLPQGPSTPDHALFDLTTSDESEPVGVLWLARMAEAGGSEAFIYDVWIRPDVRRRGLGTQALGLAETWALAQGLDRISLHVFGHNTGALALYRKLGYETTNLNLSKRLA